MHALPAHNYSAIVKSSLKEFALRPTISHMILRVKGLNNSSTEKVLFVGQNSNNPLSRDFGLVIGAFGQGSLSMAMTPTLASPGQSTPESSDVGHDSNRMSVAQSQIHRQTSASFSSQPPRAPAPLQKRKRVTRACDKCRREKIKCDGKQPCTHCTVYSYGIIPQALTCLYLYCSFLANIPGRLHIRSAFKQKNKPCTAIY